MQARNVSIVQLWAALDLVNREENYAGNLQFIGSPYHVGKTTRSAVGFRLRTVDCHKRGGRRGFMRKNNGDRKALGGCACWHAHGHFFEALAVVAPSFSIKSACSSLANPVSFYHWNEAADAITGGTYEEGNWRDKGVGSRYDPVAFSDLCECGIGNDDDEQGMFTTADAVTS